MAENEIFQQALPASTQSGRKIKKGLTRNYVQDLIALGYGFETNNRNGAKFFISEEEYQDLDLPTFDDVERNGVYKSNFIGDDGETVYMAFIMYKAGPGVAVDTAKALGLPNPKDARAKLLDVEEEFPEY